MKQRFITGTIAAVLLLALIFFGPVELIRVVVVVLSALAYAEFDRLLFPVASKKRQLRMMVLIGLGILAIRQGESIGWLSGWCFFVYLAIVNTIYWNQHGDFRRALHEFSVQWLGFVYILALLGFVLPIINLEAGREYLLLLFLIVFCGDTAAYIVGIRWGKRRLASKISPKKSIEGSIAAIVTSLLVVVGWHYFVTRAGSPTPPLVHLLLFAPVGSLLAQFGDLFESMLKRSEQIKDSGTLLPGHGGILDRIDGLALAAPMFYIFLTRIVEAS